MADTPPDKDFNVPVKPNSRKPDKSVDFPIKAPNDDAAKKLAERIAKRRGWKSAVIGTPEEKKP